MVTKSKQVCSVTPQSPTQGSSNMASSICQKRKEVIKRVHAALTNGVNPLSREEAYFMETCCCILGKSTRIRHSR
jgi:hypothetical protein